MILNLKLRSVIASDMDLIRTSGRGLSIKGQVSEQGNLLPCRVRLFEKLSGRLLEDIPTDALGNYEFNHLRASNFFVVAHHPENQYNAVIQDNVVPK